MSYKVILGDGTKFDTEVAENSTAGPQGFLHIRLDHTNPGDIYTRFNNKAATETIKAVRYIENVKIVTEKDGSKHIVTDVEQDPRVKIYRGYTTICNLEKIQNTEDDWFLTLISLTPEPEIVLEIYEDDEVTDYA